ncbi:putative inner membrane protein YjeT (clustered with HflC) [Paramagnetospirillum magnetotacticum MS-1]|uniref:Putative inner membrane protein YjeT (Clustered with HflC) n=1 Tax=Paramagnetospirillum magnetotacticum MS-1 TaxID=272627 RepID=A0A0C2Z1B7_PARME|nr:DUF2065 domain-containing protein [Paramagnetospirillum magnetotacticum]KIM00701.1 putative inner membrane protein YjeT (clustered with HflC) [Paramagnetospirillum magnetotacticum MS-1]
MTDLMTALALVLVIEGLAWAAFPEAMKRMMAQVLVMPSDLLRGVGLFMAILGILGVWLVRSAFITP